MSSTASSTYLVRGGRPGEEIELGQLVRSEALRAYRNGDPEAVRSWVARAYSPRLIRARIERDDCLLMVCEDHAGTIVGTSYAELRPGPFGTDALLAGTYLREAARGRGLMVEMYGAVVRWLQEQGARHVLAYVHADNERARHLLEVVGFTHQADVPGALVPGMLWSQMTAEVPRASA